MVFSSAIFLLFFLPVVFILNFFIKDKYSNLLLLLASLIFYAWGEPVFILIMILSIIINWLIGLMLSKTTGSSKTLFLAVGVITNLTLLGHFKYAGFFAQTANDIIQKDIFPVIQTSLPIGISFFTFQALSYVIDVYKEKTEASKSIINVALYISFFPQLIAGPIIQYKDINKQIQHREITWLAISDGFKRFIYGLSKKVLISNTLGLCVDTIYSFNISLIDTKAAWIASIAYTFQIYYDFSGYSDMAIGLGKMFGFHIPENFNYPYLSKSISEFWKRWHISLGAWFREYLYIPLGGNRKGSFRTHLNLAIVFLLTGLWHGATISFILWGIYHGFFSIIERLGLKKLLEKCKSISIIYTFLIVNFGWVLFRAGDTFFGLKMMEKMIYIPGFSNTNLETWTYMDSKTIFTLFIAFMGMGTLKSLVPDSIQKKWNGSIIEAIYCIFILILSLSSIASNTYNPFIYFQF